MSPERGGKPKHLETITKIVETCGQWAHATAFDYAASLVFASLLFTVLLTVGLVITYAFIYSFVGFLGTLGISTTIRHFPNWNAERNIQKMVANNNKLRLRGENELIAMEIEKQKSLKEWEIRQIKRAEETEIKIQEQDMELFKIQHSERMGKTPPELAQPKTNEFESMVEEAKESKTFLPDSEPTAANEKSNESNTDENDKLDEKVIKAAEVKSSKPKKRRIPVREAMKDPKPVDPIEKDDNDNEQNDKVIIQEPM